MSTFTSPLRPVGISPLTEVEVIDGKVELMPSLWRGTEGQVAALARGWEALARRRGMVDTSGLQPPRLSAAGTHKEDGRK